MNNPAIEYEIMHMERIVAQIATNCRAAVLDQQFMPYDLYLENDCGDIDMNIFKSV